MSATKYLTKEQTELIGWKMPLYTRLVWKFCLETGLRISDALVARRADFDENRYFHYTSHKTGKKGKIRLSVELFHELCDGKLPNEFIFLSKSKIGKPVTRQTVFNHIKKACKASGIDPSGIAPHSARKHFAVETFHNKGLGAAMKALQHDDVSTTLLYALSDNALTDAMNRISVLEKQNKRLREKLDGAIEILDMLAERILGDDRYEPVLPSSPERA